ncbi:MAG: RsmE family RNA methyltransferase [Elusimicrobiota bacterium]|nr:RsmE family RNA methyltransferase [Elusimicrobiota bacterium]
MPQFLIAPEDAQQKRFHLTGAEAFHVVKVLRYAKGQALDLFDGKGGRFEGVIDEIGADGTVTGRLTKTAAPAAAPARVHLYMGLLKSSNFDEALDKAVQLGAASITPLLTPRTVVLLHEVERAKTKAERWSRLVMAAAKQCGRADLPPVKEPVQFRDAIRACKDKGVVLVAWEGLKGVPAATALKDALKGAAGKDVFLFIGPEGGLSEEEIELAETEGAVAFGLGPRVLRAEAAAPAALAVIQYELGAL